jgi:hypothetical protein
MMSDNFQAFMTAAHFPETDTLPLGVSPKSACAVFFLPSFFSFPALSDAYHADNWVLAICHPFIFLLAEQSRLDLASFACQKWTDLFYFIWRPSGQSRYIGNSTNIQHLSNFTKLSQPSKTKKTKMPCCAKPEIAALNPTVLAQIVRKADSESFPDNPSRL